MNNANITPLATMKFEMKAELLREKRRIDTLLDVLDGGEETTEPVARKTRSAIHGHSRKHMSLATRRKISKSMKSSWETGRNAGRKLTPETRKKIAIAQKKRWAKQKKASHTVLAAAAAA